MKLISIETKFFHHPTFSIPIYKYEVDGVKCVSMKFYKETWRIPLKLIS